jgi:gliding motility-associated-like protein
MLCFVGIFAIYTMKYFIFGLLLLSFSLLHAQWERDWWFLGYGASLNFHHGTAPTSEPNGAFYNREGGSTICDPAGNLLFYTDGDTVWNRLHQVMLNGTGLMGGTLGSSCMQALIVPQPLTPNIYYIFTTDEDPNLLANGLRYSVVDMSLNGGLGDVLTSNKNTLLTTNMSERVCGAANADGTGYWIISHEHTGNGFYAYLLTSTGLNMTPVVSNVGRYCNYTAFQSGVVIGNLKVSPQLNKIAIGFMIDPSNGIGMHGSAQLVDFDNQTGIISNPIDFTSVLPTDIYGVAFSPNGRYLYLAYSDIYQVDTWAGSNTAIFSSLDTFSQHFSILYLWGANLTLSNDGKIYLEGSYPTIAGVFPTAFNVIASPNNALPNVGFHQDTLPLQYGHLYYSFPNFCVGYFPNHLADFTLCEATPFYLYGYNHPSASSYLWQGPNGFTSTQMKDTLPFITTAAAGDYYYSMADSAGNIVWRDTLTLTVLPTYQDTVYLSICAGDSVLLLDSSYVHSAGIYPVSLESVNTCDSTIITILHVEPAYFDTTHAAICTGDSYLLANGTSIGAAGIYPVLLQSQYGCDSTVTTILQVNPTYNDTVFAAICQGNIYVLPNGNNVNTAGTYPVLLQTNKGCDSLITSILQVNPSYKDTVFAAICAGSSYLLPNGNSVTMAGTYPVLLQTHKGCDSLVTSILRVNPSYKDTVFAAICAGNSYLLPNGNSVTMAGTYPVLLQTDKGCDSLVTSILQVNPSYKDTVFAAICGGDTYNLPNGNSVATAGTYPVLLQTNKGCDSLITTLLQVNPSHKDTIFAAICEGDTYTFPNGNVVTLGGDYLHVYAPTQNGCDSSLLTYLRVYPHPILDLGNDLTLCEGQYAVFSAPTNAASYSWNTGATSPQIIATQVGLYSVKVTTADNCTKTDSVRITAIYPIPKDFLPEDTTLCYGYANSLPWQGISITVAGYESYLWNDNSTSNNFTITQAGLYTLIVENEGHCQGKDSLNVSDNCPMAVYIPNIFTPNGDGDNELFQVFGENILSLQVTIFDRWGREIKTLNSLQETWDGADMPEGTYTYKCVAKGTNGQKLLRGGTVLLLR